MDEMEELRQEFLSEANELLLLMEEEVLNLENDPQNRESVNSIFRVAHTLKGGAAALELNRISVFTHNLENLLDLVRDEKLLVDEELIDIVLHSLDILKELVQKAALQQEAAEGFENQTLEQIKIKAKIGDQKIATSSVKPALKTVSVIKEATTTPTNLNSKTETSFDFDDEMLAKLEKDFSITEERKHYIQKAFQEGQHLFVLYVSFDQDYEMKSVSGIQTITAMKSMGEIVSSSPAINVIMVEEFVPQIQFLFLTKETSETIYSKVYLSDVFLDLEIENISYLFGGDSFEEEINRQENPSENLFKSVENQQRLSLLDTFPYQEITPKIHDAILEALNVSHNVFQVRILINKDVLMRDVDSLLVLTTLEEVGDIISAVPSKRDLQKELYYPVLDIIIETTESISLIKERAFIDETILEIRVLTFKLTGDTVAQIHENEINFLPTIDDEMIEKPLTDSILPLTHLEKKETQQPVPQKVESVVFEELEGHVPVSLTQNAAEINSQEFGKERTFSEKLLSKEESRIKGIQTGEQAAIANVIKTFLKVDSLRVDSLLNLVSELVITKAALLEMATAFISSAGEYKIGKQDSQELLRSVAVKFPALQDTILKVINYLDFVALGWSNVDAFEQTVNAISRSINELQEGIMKIRMVPISNIFNKFTRLVRDTSKQLGKNVQLNFIGEDTELDKSIIEELSDPLMHMVRNSIDHGIEMPDIREKKGKPQQGTISLKAFHEGNVVKIQVVDDGAGLDPVKIHQKAIEKGLVSAGQSLTKEEILQLILLPGFSTAEKITDLSGRGVGMDVVRRNIEELSGTLSITSELGKGSTMTIKIPLTLSIIQALIVKIKGYFFSIPLNLVSETIPLDLSRIQKYEKGSIIYVNDEMVSIVDLKKIFNIKESRYDKIKRYQEEMSSAINTDLLDESIAILENSVLLKGATNVAFQQQNFYHEGMAEIEKPKEDDLYLVVISLGNKKMGLLVDGIVAEQDIVIKPLHKAYGLSKGVSGATILGDGSISLILDVAQIAELYVKQEEIAIAQ